MTDLTERTMSALPALPAPWFFEVLPSHPPPYPGECLSGYLVRLAEANGGARLWDLARDLFPRWQGPGYSHRLQLFRWEYPVEEWGRMPVRTHLARADLQRLTVAPWVAKFRPLPIVASPGLRSPAPLLQGVVHQTLRICPPCLQAHPFVRLIWRLSSVEACLEHGVLLQTQCPGCAQPLTVIGPAHRPLRCARCGRDLRTWPTLPASRAVLATQQRVQGALHFLLDPTARLVPPEPPESPAPPSAAQLSQMRDVAATEPTTPTTFTAAEAIGRRLRYLRVQAGLSVAAMARRLAAGPGTLSALELGREPVALPLYLTYLDALSLSWPDFAALDVPVEELRRLEEPAYLTLRLCPTPGCPHHQPPPGTGVSLLADLPDRRIVRFRCTACVRTFTRDHDGALVTRWQGPPRRPGDSAPPPKSTAAIARLTELGLRGLPNRQIARQLGWGEKTVRRYWIALDLVNRVHAAQAQRRAREVRHHHAALRAQVAAIVWSLRRQETELTARQVGEALGHNSDYLHSYPAVAAQVQAVARRRNARLRQRREAAVAARVTQVLDAELARAAAPEALTMRKIASQVGLSPDHLQAAYPALHARVRHMVAARRAELEAARRQRHCAQIDAAAARLVARGVHLAHDRLLKEANVSRYYSVRDPVVYNQLADWIGDHAP